MTPTRWLLPSPDPAVDTATKEMARALNVPAFMARMLARRGFRTSEAA